MKRTALLAALSSLAASLVAPAASAADASSDLGTWSFVFADLAQPDKATVRGPRARVVRDASGGTFTPEGSTLSDRIDSVIFDPTSRLWSFRRVGDATGTCGWYRGRIVHGVFVGRAYTAAGRFCSAPGSYAAYTTNATALNQAYVDAQMAAGGGAPRAYEISIVDAARTEYVTALRLDRTATATAGTLKVIGARAPGATAVDVTREEAEDDLRVEQYDVQGGAVRFARITSPSCTQVYTGTMTGDEIRGTYTNCGGPGGTFSGKRVSRLSFGLLPKPAAYAAWQERARAQIAHLMMGGGSTHTLADVSMGPALAPLAYPRYHPSRNDFAPDGTSPPAAYTRREVKLRYLVRSAVSPSAPPAERIVHGWLFAPTTASPLSGTPTVYPGWIHAHGHMDDGVIHASQHPESWYWFGEAMARRGFAVFMVDVPHYVPSDTRSRHPGEWRGPNNEDPEIPNDVRPAITSIRFGGAPTSEWEEDGERVWAASRAREWLASGAAVDGAGRPMAVAPAKIGSGGLSMGSEVAEMALGLDPNFSFGLVVSAPSDTLTIRHLPAVGNHPCFTWANAALHEMVDFSDFLGLASPRVVLVQKPQREQTYAGSEAGSNRQAKQSFRRALAAYSSGGPIHMRFQPVPFYGHVFSGSRFYGSCSPPASSWEVCYPEPVGGVCARPPCRTPRGMILANDVPLTYPPGGSRAWQDSLAGDAFAHDTISWLRQELGGFTRPID